MDARWRGSGDVPRIMQSRQAVEALVMHAARWPIGLRRVSADLRTKSFSAEQTRQPQRSTWFVHMPPEPLLSEALSAPCCSSAPTHWLAAVQLTSRCPDVDIDAPMRAFILRTITQGFASVQAVTWRSWLIGPGFIGEGKSIIIGR